MEKSAQDWREILGEAAYRVTREGGTERAFSHPWGRGELSEEMRAAKARGTGGFVCLCCGAWLFDLSDKFDSGCGWPSFRAGAAGAPLKALRDTSHGMERVEIRCGSCEAHLGHVFPDGPAPKGLRYCINGVALEFVDK